VFGGATDRSRGNVNCNLFQSNLFLDGVPASASCLRNADLWYAVYSIAQASYEFTLTLTLTTAAPNATRAGAGAAAAAPPPPAQAQREVLTLSPVTIVTINEGRTVAAELLGDLGGFQARRVCRTADARQALSKRQC
jgi:hypothetical protein